MLIMAMLFRGGFSKSKLFIIVLVIAGIWFFVGNPFSLLDGSSGITAQSGTYEPTAEEQELYEFVAVVMADTEDVWNRIFAERGAQYVEPDLVVFNQRIQSACGGASSAMGPFYCPADQSAYIDLHFYKELSQRFSSPGDFAMAYVIAHEVGHHVQNLMGTSDQVHRARGNLNEEEYNQLSVRLELQADFYAGVWAHHAQEMFNSLEAGDIEEALRAASAIGDDNIQRQTQGRVSPESFTHGTSEQRVRWFRKGYQTGDIEQGNTFDTEAL